MADDDAQTRSVLTLPVGARLGVVAALLLLVGAGYLLWSPIQLYPADGFPIMCGSGAQLPADNLGTAACGRVNEIRQWQAGALAAAALVVLAGSIYAFGVRRRVENLIGAEDSTREDTASALD